MSTFGRNLLACVGVALIVFGLALIVLPFATSTSGLVIAPGVPVLGLGVALVILAANDQTSGGRGRFLGLWFWFGRQSDDTEDDARDDEPRGSEHERPSGLPALPAGDPESLNVGESGWTGRMLAVGRRLRGVLPRGSHSGQ